MGAVPKVDLAGAELLAELHRLFRDRGIELRVAEAHGEVRDALLRAGFEREFGTLETGQTVDLVVSDWLAAQGRNRTRPVFSS